ncbi:carbohydrate ABC transporter permease [Georgenia sp. SYP-B2076]|uniref:carbohydrate ABC transporter permease n=1 Tax=Georgenia sp. SYP-B2076 TaxID=2495881 RepID=UPI000F8ED332|nr:carbohydrate ABC transporter permease [Georgenia sp. SYP-B2076]
MTAVATAAGERTAGAGTPAVRPSGRSGRRRPPAGRVALHAVLLVGGLLMVAPFLWMLLTSLKTLPQLLTDPLSLLPAPATTGNFAQAWQSLPFGRAYVNSIYIAVLVVAGTLVTAAMAGYAFARIPFRGAKVLFLVFLATQMIPKQVTLVPFYLLMARLGWVDSHLALIVPAALANPFAVFLMRQFVLSIPRELTEAATLDGAGQVRTFFSVILPNLRPGLGALSIIVVLDTWNNFLFPLVLLNSQELFTVPLLLASFQGQYGAVNYGLVMAASAVATVPMLIAFLLGQRRIIASMAASGLGGR